MNLTDLGTWVGGYMCVLGGWTRRVRVGGGVGGAQQMVRHGHGDDGGGVRCA
jgi:hypothetical protein